MIISLKHRFIFIKGYKVAGTSVESFLSQILEDDAIISGLPDGHFPHHHSRNFLNVDGTPLFIDHMSASAIRSIIGTWLYERMYKFGIIRNPFEKIISLYAMRKLEKPGFTFDMAISDIPTEREMLCDGNSLIVHKVILYENLNEQLSEVFSQIGIPFRGNLYFHERTKSRNLLKSEIIHLTKDNIEKITDKFSFELEMYARMGHRITIPKPGPRPIGLNR
jgi:hypothetical protein